MTARVLAAAVAATMLMGSSIAQAATVNCRSDGGYERCTSDTSGGVVLQRELRGNCVEDRSWGYDPGGIWVDRGCSAEFAVRGDDGGGIGAGTAIGVIGAIAAIGAVAALAASDDDNDNDRGSSGSSAKREDQAISLCTDYANQVVRDAGGRGARLDRVKRTHRDGDKWQVEAYMEARWPDQKNPTRFIDCTVNFEGSNRVAKFRHDGLDDPPRRGGGGGSHGHGDNDRQWRDRAVLACENEAKRRDFKVRDVSDISHHRRGYDMVLRLEQKRHGDRERFNAECRYDTNRQEAWLDNISQRG